MAKENYHKALESALEELETLLADEEKIQERILSLRKTIHALSVLCEEAGEAGEWRERAAQALGFSWQGSVTEDVLRVVTSAFPIPVTASEVRDELRKLGTLDDHKNPLATIHAVLNRLTEQGKAKETTKSGRKAWEPTRVPISSLSGIRAGLQKLNK